jgi:Tol biopolymer transport system component/DNA-binding winged helix-turn-helix (wHTH) protein
MPAATYRFGEVEVEVAGREVRRSGERVPLEPKALDVLLLLLADAGRVVDKRRLLREVWADVHVTDSSLARAVTQVRRAIGDDPKTPRFVETVPTRGYRFIGRLAATDDAVAAVEATPAQTGAPAVEPPPGEAPVSLRSRRARLGLTVMAVASGAVLLAAALAGLVPRAQVVLPASATLGASLVDAATRQAVQLTTSRGLDADPSLSPDGSWLAYASDSSGALEIFVRPRMASGQARAVTANRGDNVDPAWSPDGQWLAYHSRRFGGIWVVPAGGGPARQLAGDGSSPGWAPDGQAIVYQTAGEADILGGSGGSDSTLAIVRVATAETTALTRPGDPPGSHGSPVWLTGQAGIVFVAVRVPAAELWHVTPGGRAARLGACHATCRPFTFRRGGVTWVGAVRGGKAGELWLAPISSTGQVDVAQARTTSLPRAVGISDLAVSADGSVMAFTDAERTSEAWSLDIPATGDAVPRALLNERRPRYSEFAFSPDGQRLAYTTSRLGDPPEVWIHDLVTAQSRQLAAPTAGFVKSWTPDGRAVTTVDPHAPFGLHRVDVATGRSAPLLRLDHWSSVPDFARRLFTLRLSRDGRRYFYTSDESGAPGIWMAEVEGGAPAVLVSRGTSFGAWAADGERIAVQVARGWRTSLGVHVRGRDGIRQLVTDADHAWPNGWSPDDRAIVYAALREGRWAIEVVDVATARVRRLTEPGSASEYVRWPVWSPAGDRIVYERGYWTGNVWVAGLPEI